MKCKKVDYKKSRNTPKRGLWEKVQQNMPKRGLSDKFEPSNGKSA
jgi:hypothetical protein